MKIFMIFIISMMLDLLLTLIFMNSSFLLYFEINFFYMMLNVQYNFLWFMFFMLLMLLFLVFLLSKKMMAYNKFNILLMTYMFITFTISLLSLTDDFMFFMIIFESLFFPMCFISLFFNFNNSFMFAMFYLMMFSSMSSMMCMIMCLIIILHFNTLNLMNFMDMSFYDNLYLNIYLWILFFIMFSIKYPMWPLHIWLPEVHVEVNSEMSALLASIVLKIGFFGMFKFMFLLYNQTSMWFMGFIDAIMMLGITFLAFALLFLCDYKKMMAHWSVMHTGMGLVLLWHNDLMFIGILFFCNLGHIISSGFMFIIIGYMYDNYGLRIFLLLMSFFGISMWSSMFLALFLFNMDFPFMLLFFMDIFVLYGLVSLSFLYVINFFFMVLMMFVSSMYIYICLTYFSFIWMDKYLSLDLTINDIFMFFTSTGIMLIFFFLMYLLF